MLITSAQYWVKKKVRDLEPNHVQKLYNRMVAADIGVHTIRKVHTVLNSALNHAVKSFLITRNPASFAIQPSLPEKEMDILDEAQVDQFLETATGHRWEMLYQLAILTGMRQMEILGLQWKDMDWSRKTILVDRQLVRTDLDSPRFITPKTRHGRRSIALGPKTIKALKMHRENQRLDAKNAGSSWEKYDLIFTTANGTPIHHRNLLRNYKALLREAGLPEIRFHDLRHTAASLMLNRGIPVIVVSRILGHARASITLDVYGHLTPTMQDEAARLMDELIFDEK